MSDTTTTQETARKRAPSTAGPGAVYTLGMIGAAVYYWRHSAGGSEHAKALGKALVWPAFVVYDLLGHLSEG